MIISFTDDNSNAMPQQETEDETEDANEEKDEVQDSEQEAEATAEGKHKHLSKFEKISNIFFY